MPDFVLDTFQIFSKTGVILVMSPIQVADLGCVNMMAILRINVRGRLSSEPAYSIHILLVSEDNTEAWFSIYGCNVNIDEGGSILSSVDAKSVLQTYQEVCKALGLDSGNMIVVG